MATKPIRLPRHPSLPLALPTVTLSPTDLIRVSGHTTGEPYFGRSGLCRFDDPNTLVSSRYGTSYFGVSLAVAFAETLLHNRTPKKGTFYVDIDTIRNRYALHFKGESLILANLTGASLKRLGGHAGLTGTSSYTTPQRWSSAIYNHPDCVDGILYMSRHKNDEKAVVLFDRAQFKIQMTTATRLDAHPEIVQVIKDLYIVS
jgi:hypothetical protein